MTDHRESAILQEDQAWRRARARATAQRDFLAHLAIYLAVNSLLVVIDVAAGSSDTTFLGLDWAYWPIGGWGLGLAIHAIWAFAVGSNWTEQRAAQLYEEEQRRGLRR